MYYLGTKDDAHGPFNCWDNKHARSTTKPPSPDSPAHSAFITGRFLVSDTHTFSPTWVFHSAFNYLQTYRKETPVSPITPQSVGVQSTASADRNQSQNILHHQRLYQAFQRPRAGIRSSGHRVSKATSATPSASIFCASAAAFATIPSTRSTWPMNSAISLSAPPAPPPPQ